MTVSRGTSETVRVGALALEVTAWDNGTTDFKVYNEKADYFKPLVAFTLTPEATESISDLLDRSTGQRR